MSINYQEDIKPLEDIGISDASIALHLSLATLSPIPCSTVREVLQESGSVIVDPASGSKSGPLISYYQTLAAGSADQVLFAYFLQHSFGSGVDVKTNEYPRSIQWAQATAGLPSSLQPVALKIVDGGGGRPHPNVTESDVVAHREQFEADQAASQAEREARENFDGKKTRYDELYNDHIAPLQIQPGVTDADWTAALNSMADNFSSPTVE